MNKIIIIGNIVSLVACLLLLISGYNKKHTFLLQTVQLPIMGISYLILGSFAGLVSNILAIIRNGLYHYKKYNLFAKISLSLLTIIIVLIDFKPMDILVILAVIPHNILLTDDDKKLKMLTIYYMIPWAIYAYLNQNYISCIFDIAICISSIIGLIRLREV